MKEDSKKNEKEQCTIPSVSCSAIVENEQVELFFQFDNDEPISAMRCNGKKFKMEMIPVENSFVTFTDGKKNYEVICEALQLTLQLNTVINELKR